MTEPVTIQYDGPCCTTADCWDDLSPVCDNTGNTHLVGMLNNIVTQLCLESLCLQ